MATATIVSPSALVVAALDEAVRAHFDIVVRSPNLAGINLPVTDADVILYDMQSSQAEVASLLQFGATHERFLQRVAVMTHEDTVLADLIPVIGAVGAILPSSSTAQEIAMTARAMRTGLVILPADILALCKAVTPNASTPDLIAEFGLTHRETEVVNFLTEGQSNKMIARELGINDTTVRVYVRSILQKLGLQNRTQAALFFSDKNGAANRRR
jgi:two-component system nitrate/nitrite response regulator NarL